MAADTPATCFRIKGGNADVGILHRPIVRAVTLRGINIQMPFANLLCRGEKTIEVRSYPLQTYQGEDLLVIATPGQAKETWPIHLQIQISGSPSNF